MPLKRRAVPRDYSIVHGRVIRQVLLHNSNPEFDREAMGALLEMKQSQLYNCGDIPGRLAGEHYHKLSCEEAGYIAKITGDTRIQEDQVRPCGKIVIDVPKDEKTAIGAVKTASSMMKECSETVDAWLKAMKDGKLEDHERLQVIGEL